eukprot:480804-Pyramimonas_sp.AAC.1
MIARAVELTLAKSPGELHQTDCTTLRHVDCLTSVLLSYGHADSSAAAVVQAPGRPHSGVLPRVSR